MACLTLSVLSLVTFASKLVFADQPDPSEPTPLVDYHYAYPSQLPYQVYPFMPDKPTIRGPQTGYNICNSTTEGLLSQCQTAMVNHLNDFCVWGPPNPDSTIGDNEGDVIIWCSKPGRGGRPIPPTAIQGAQLLRTNSYIQIVGFVNQILLNIALDDQGGMLDPHGSDKRGNPIGGLMYSNAFPSNAGNNDTYQQAIEWTNVMGNNMFCITICDATTSTTDQLAYCDFKYDRLNCTYNMPNNAQNGVFEVCESDLKTPVGIYTNQDGYTLSWTQPSTGAANPPYTPTPPASSNCFTYQSTDLYGPTPIIPIIPLAQAGVMRPTPAPSQTRGSS